MNATVAPTLYSTVSRQFIADWLAALRPLCSDPKYLSFLKRADLMTDQNTSQRRVTLDQVVCLYQLAAVETGDDATVTVTITDHMGSIEFIDEWSKWADGYI